MLQTMKLRQIQSSYYQSLFQSGPKPLENPWPTICAAQLDLDHSAQLMHASNAQGNIKLLFRSDILYTRVLLLSPPRLAIPLVDYGQMLVLEYAIAYAHTTSALTSDPVNIALCSSYDLLRAYYVAQRLIDVLTNYSSACASDILPTAPTAKGPIALPPLTIRRGRERTVAAIEGMQLLDSTIRGLGKKYGFPRSWIDFKLKADSVLATLRARAG